MHSQFCAWLVLPNFFRFQPRDISISINSCAFCHVFDFSKLCSVIANQLFLFTSASLLFTSHLAFHFLPITSHLLTCSKRRVIQLAAAPQSVSALFLRAKLFLSDRHGENAVPVQLRNVFFHRFRRQQLGSPGTHSAI